MCVYICVCVYIYICVCTYARVCVCVRMSPSWITALLWRRALHNSMNL